VFRRLKTLTHINGESLQYMVENCDSEESVFESALHLDSFLIVTHFKFQFSRCEAQLLCDRNIEIQVD